MSSSVSPRITLPVIENAIRSCETHLNSSGARGSEIESYFMCYLLILICGEYEKLIKEKVVERARRASDPDLASFVERTVKSFLVLEFLRSRVVCSESSVTITLQCSIRRPRIPKPFTDTAT